MLTSRWNSRGRTSLRVRILATMVVVAMVGLTAPVVLVPLVRWVVDILAAVLFGA